MFAQCVFRFLFGGTLMLAVYLVGQKSVNLAGLLSAAPIFSGAFLALNMSQGKPNAQLIAQTLGSAEGMLCGLGFYVAANLALRCKLPAPAVVGVGCAACVATYFAVKYVKKLAA